MMRYCQKQVCLTTISKIQLVGQKNIQTKHLALVIKAILQSFFVAKTLQNMAGAFRY